MIKSTPEFEKKIKESGIPIIEINLEDLKRVSIVTEEEKLNIYKHIKKKNNGITSNR